MGLELAEVIGHLAELKRFPFEPLDGESPAIALLAGDGLTGDRAYELFDPATGEPLTPSSAPSLLSLRARYLDNLITEPRPEWACVEPPSGRELSLQDPACAAALSEWLGRPVRLRARTRKNGTSALFLLSRATLRLAERTYGAPLESGRIRANLVVDVTEAEAFAEERWLGKRIRIGDALLEIVGQAPDCVFAGPLPSVSAGDADLLRGLLQVRRGGLGVALRALSGLRLRVGDALALAD